LLGFEIALSFRSDAFRAVYAVQLAEEIWVVHAVSEEIDAGHQDAQARG
jgi:hypothetical protein